jgi:hypothetical protein
MPAVPGFCILSNQDRPHANSVTNNNQQQPSGAHMHSVDVLGASRTTTSNKRADALNRLTQWITQTFSASSPA